MSKLSIVEVGSEGEFVLELKGDVNPEKEVPRFLEVFPDGGKELKVTLIDSKFVKDVELGFFRGFEEFLQEFPEENLEKEEYIDILLFQIGCGATMIIENVTATICNILGSLGFTRL